MASLGFILKWALVFSLRECGVERQTLGGVDLIIDTATAVMFINLFSLSARYVAFLERVAQQSRKHRRLLVVFEAYLAPRTFEHTGLLLLRLRIALNHMLIHH